MAHLYSDENFPIAVVESLRQFGHDVLTALQAGQANKKIPDPLVLTYAIGLGRSVLTLNRHDYIKLHKRTARHTGIVVCTDDLNTLALAQRIHDAMLKESPLDNKLVRVNKPSVP